VPRGLVCVCVCVRACACACVCVGRRKPAEFVFDGSVSNLPDSNSLFYLGT
jgi:hypothetical protein